LSFIMTMVI